MFRKTCANFLALFFFSLPACAVRDGVDELMQGVERCSISDSKEVDFNEKRDIVVDFVEKIPRYELLPDDDNKRYELLPDDDNKTYQQAFAELVDVSPDAISRLRRYDKYGPMFSVVNKTYEALIGTESMKESPGFGNFPHWKQALVGFICHRLAEVQKTKDDLRDALLLEDHESLALAGHKPITLYRLSLRKYSKLVEDDNSAKRYVLSPGSLRDLLERQYTCYLEQIGEIDFSNQNMFLETANAFLREVVLRKDQSSKYLLPNCCELNLSNNLLALGNEDEEEQEFINLLEQFVHRHTTTSTVYLCGNFPSIQDDWVNQLQDSILRNAIVLHTLN